jgi:glycosyltransferase involved in cell wall biosynthesis
VPAPVGDIEAIAERLVQLAESADLRPRMGESGRQAVRARFDPDAHTRKLLELYGLDSAPVHRGAPAASA